MQEWGVTLHRCVAGHHHTGHLQRRRRPGKQTLQGQDRFLSSPGVYWRSTADVWELGQEEEGEERRMRPSTGASGESWHWERLGCRGRRPRHGLTWDYTSFLT